MVSVYSVAPDSPAEKAGILSGDIIISVNGNEIFDVLDYDFHTAEKKAEILIHRGAELLTFRIKKGEYEPLGCEFETYLIDKKQTCRNKCVFCFIDQNPPGMRDTVYFKDDDSRMSFLSGNYITLTNLSERDAERIVKMHISPINISVHTTNPELRVKLMANKNAGASLSYIEKFAEAEIWMNVQIVLCPGLNDGAELERTLSDLKKYIPALRSIAVVPVGLTKYRCGLYPLRSVTKEDALSVISTVEKFGDGLLKKYGERIAYPSDEFYLKAGLDIPCDGFYEDYPQLDNGVGMIRSFLSEVEFAAEEEKPKKSLPGEFSVATGYAAYDTLLSARKTICDAVYGGSCDFAHIYRIKNDFFGDTVTVAGLITGNDLINQLKGKPLGEVLYIPKVMLRYEQDRFLDDVTLTKAEEELKVKIVPAETDGNTFTDIFLGNICDFTR